MKALTYLSIINIVAFALVGIDKRAAINGRYRVPNYVWWLLALAGGGILEYLAMRLFHHKTLKKSFMIGIPLIIIAQIGLLIYELSL